MQSGHACAVQTLFSSFRFTSKRHPERHQQNSKKPPKNCFDSGVFFFTVFGTISDLKMLPKWSQNDPQSRPGPPQDPPQGVTGLPHGGPQGTPEGPGPHFGPFWPNFGPKHFFLQKSEFVTFLDLLKANLVQKIRKN